jgi:MoxR-like ATPase
MGEHVDINNSRVLLADPAIVPDRPFIGRGKELEMCRIAWGISPDGSKLLPDGGPPLSFRLEGAPGLGKNEIVYELARRLNKPLYILQGHEEFTPEDLALLLTPDTDAEYGGSIPLTLRASPLATALYTGGLFFFDEINRVPERALSPLASVLDGRQYIYSAMTGMNIGPRDDDAFRDFRFCCALNPSLSNAGRVLPEYIEQRTLSVIEIKRPPIEDIREILAAALKPSQEFLDDFEEWYAEEQHEQISVRQAIALMNYAMNYERQVGAARAGGRKIGILRQVSEVILGRRG